MKIGTKSLLFGVHQVFLHPLFVAWAWWKIYGFPRDPRLWVAFIVHDWGYWGCSNMDGPEGERHVELGARIMHLLFDWIPFLRDLHKTDASKPEGTYARNFRWHDFSLYHSRFRAKQDGVKPSRLCVADKLVPSLMPAWFYLPLSRLSGEIHEYMKLASDRTPNGDQAKYVHMRLSTASQRAWFRDVQIYLRNWVEAHKDGGTDTWTRLMPDNKDDSDQIAERKT